MSFAVPWEPGRKRPSRSVASIVVVARQPPQPLGRPAAGAGAGGGHLYDWQDRDGQLYVDRGRQSEMEQARHASLLEHQGGKRVENRLPSVAALVSGPRVAGRGRSSLVSAPSPTQQLEEEQHMAVARAARQMTRQEANFKKALQEAEERKRRAAGAANYLPSLGADAKARVSAIQPFAKPHMAPLPESPRPERKKGPSKALPKLAGAPIQPKLPGGGRSSVVGGGVLPQPSAPVRRSLEPLRLSGASSVSDSAPPSRGGLGSKHAPLPDIPLKREPLAAPKPPAANLAVSVPSLSAADLSRPVFSLSPTIKAKRLSPVEASPTPGEGSSPSPSCPQAPSARSAELVDRSSLHPAASHFSLKPSPDKNPSPTPSRPSPDKNPSLTPAKPSPEAKPSPTPAKPSPPSKVDNPSPGASAAASLKGSPSSKEPSPVKAEAAGPGPARGPAGSLGSSPAAASPQSYAAALSSPSPSKPEPVPTIPSPSTAAPPAALPATSEPGSTDAGAAAVLGPLRVSVEDRDLFVISEEVFGAGADVAALERQRAAAKQRLPGGPDPSKPKQPAAKAPSPKPSSKKDEKGTSGKKSIKSPTPGVKDSPDVKNIASGKKSKSPTGVKNDPDEKDSAASSKKSSKSPTPSGADMSVFALKAVPRPPADARAGVESVYPGLRLLPADVPPLPAASTASAPEPPSVSRPLKEADTKAKKRAADPSPSLPDKSAGPSPEPPSVRKAVKEADTKARKRPGKKVRPASEAAEPLPEKPAEKQADEAEREQRFRQLRARVLAEQEEETAPPPRAAGPSSSIEDMLSEVAHAEKLLQADRHGPKRSKQPDKTSPPKKKGGAPSGQVAPGGGRQDGGGAGPAGPSRPDADEAGRREGRKRDGAGAKEEPSPSAKLLEHAKARQAQLCEDRKAPKEARKEEPKEERKDGPKEARKDMSTGASKDGGASDGASKAGSDDEVTSLPALEIITPKRDRGPSHEEYTPTPDHAKRQPPLDAPFEVLSWGEGQKIPGSDVSTRALENVAGKWEDEPKDKRKKSKKAKIDPHASDAQKRQQQEDLRKGKMQELEDLSKKYDMKLLFAGSKDPKAGHETPRSETSESSISSSVATSSVVTAASKKAPEPHPLDNSAKKVASSFTVSTILGRISNLGKNIKHSLLSPRDT